MTNSNQAVAPRLIHISFGGPEYRLSADKPYRFEDHPYCGPIVVGATGDPLENQPKESSIFWQHVNAWYQQGKKFKEVCGERWCVYETQMQEARRLGRSRKAGPKRDSLNKEPA